jgi:ubiquinone/menaquinone biosynthesis C-methylase UbiE
LKNNRNYFPIANLKQIYSHTLIGKYFVIIVVNKSGGRNMSGKHLFSTGNSTRKYYKSMNNTYKQIYGKHLMLHYPFYKSDKETLERRQLNLTDYCLSKIDNSKEQTLLEVGCGNGVQSIYIHEVLNPSRMVGVDLNPDNIELAHKNKNGCKSLDFKVDDAQQLSTIPDSSVDILLCIESAFHYPQKELFLQQVKRVLKPTGKFIIADILNKTHNRKYITKRWKRRMVYHHWTELQYIDTFNELGLQVDYIENITKPVMDGYEGSKHWIARENCSNFVNFILFRLFAHIQVGINLRLLRKKEDYILFTGSHKLKPVVIPVHS